MTGMGHNPSSILVCLWSETGTECVVIVKSETAITGIAITTEWPRQA